MALKVTRQNISEHLFEYQLSLIGKTVQDAIKTPDWRQKWELPSLSSEIFRAYSIPLIKKTFRCNKSKAEKTFDFFLANFGLKVYQIS